jgi:hypothetical protein
MNKLYAFGDSFTWGTDLKDAVTNGSREGNNYDIYKKYHSDRVPLKKGIYQHFFDWKKCYSRNTWTALLANDNNLIYECHAIQGASNQTILRQILKKLPTLTSNDLVVINWTWINRWDFYDNSNTKWETLRPTNNSNDTFNTIYFKYIQSELWDKLESLKTISLVSNILKQQNIKFMMTCMDNTIINTTCHAPDYITILQDNIKDEVVWFDNTGFHQWSIDNKYKISDTGQHPLEDAHCAAFMYIKNTYDFTQ